MTGGCIGVHKLTAYRSGTQICLLAAKASVGFDIVRLTIVLLCEIYTSGIYAHETRVRKMHAYEVHAHEVHANEMHAYDTHVREMRAREVHAHKIDAREMHARKIRAYKIFAYLIRQ